MLIKKKNAPEVTFEDKEPVVQESRKAPVKPAFKAMNKTLIGKGVTFVGDFSTADPIEINGKIEGKITSESTVEIAPAGTYHGDASVNNLILHGQAEGFVQVADLAKLTETATMVGQLITARLLTEDGSSFDGDMTIMKKRAPQYEAPAQTAEEAPAAAPVEETAEVEETIEVEEAAPVEEVIDKEVLEAEENLVEQLKASVAESSLPPMKDDDIAVDEEFLFGKH